MLVDAFSSFMHLLGESLSRLSHPNRRRQATLTDTSHSSDVNMYQDTASPNHTASQSYLSTRGGDYGLSFETVVLKGLAADGGLFLPHQIPRVENWQEWKDLSYTELAFRIFSLFISTDEIPSDDLKAIIERSYSTFRADNVAPLIHLQDNNLYLLELFHGPSYSFKDCALQFLGNLFEYFLVRRNQGKEGKDRHHLTVVGATSGDTGSAAIYGLRGKKDVSVFILHPKDRVSPIQEAQMTTCLDANVHNIAVTGTFDDCQDIVKALFGDPETNDVLKLGAVNSINFSRILAQIVYYFHAYFSLAMTSDSFKVGDQVRFVTPTGNFGNILAGYLATRMGLPADKLIVATNENDILYRFWKTGRYEKQPAANGAVKEGHVHSDGCKETLSPAMDILVSSNFERLMWFLAEDFASTVGMDEQFNKKQAGQEVTSWYQSLKASGGFGPVHPDILEAGRRTFGSERVSDAETLKTIQSCYSRTKYVLDPHTAVGVAAATRSIAEADVKHISLSTAHPAKFSGAVEAALKDDSNFNFNEQVLPAEFKDLLHKEKRVIFMENSWEKVRGIIKKQVDTDLL
ncbi:tryptophan synthase beta subunit-like PLP-dependent enzyme [Xylaria bambusicola]|uniref:tryptophan synthase beta subunit-like PLP-dependent enzyme n=1 Tax=Xylaria bambusicola TaxID=326684 RepID=UPI002007D560|nr:tryptophan synthase beta subunit-like PLP-dependent enzyme [Xylaria bambusicola]KAI0517673.1 tryptophan synthase beta subunit-like PLP-dependent enzyme [Xylaria bambusicola]